MSIRLAVLALLVLSGCTPSQIGAVALAHTNNGIDVVVVACEGHFDEVVLSAPDDGGDTFASWRFEEPFDGVRRWNWAAPELSSAWKLMEPVRPVREASIAGDQELLLGAWLSNDGGASSPLRFKLRDAQRLRPGWMLVPGSDGAEAKEVTPGAWARRACEKQK